jgi:hypothetical protein
MNIMGQKVFEQFYNFQNRVEIDLSGKKPGMYFIKYMEGETIITKRIILKGR